MRPRPRLSRRSVRAALAGGVLAGLAGLAGPGPGGGSGLVPALRAADPVEWVDPDTGHRVVRLSDEPGTDTLYFTQNGYSPDGRLLYVTTHGAIGTIDWRTRAHRALVERGPGEPSLRGIMTGRRTGTLYYQQGTAVCGVDPTTGAVRRIAELPPDTRVDTVNADETLLAGAQTLGVSHAAEARKGPGSDNYPGKGEFMERRLAERLPMVLFTVDVRTGRRRDILHSTDWLNHFQFSPTDPGALLFCHEGPWHKVDRLWTVRVDGPDGAPPPVPVLVHRRRLVGEIAGHEFWGRDGAHIWYDLQTPRGVDLWVAGVEPATGARLWYHLERDQKSVHYNVSPDGALFAGDGTAAPKAMARPGSGDNKWILLLRPVLAADSRDAAEGAKGAEAKGAAAVAGVGVGAGVDAAGPLVRTGSFRTERLVNMARHDYGLEPNVTFTPDGTRLIFRSNMSGADQVYSVDIARAAR